MITVSKKGMIDMATQTMSVEEILNQLQLDYNNYQKYRQKNKLDCVLSTKEDMQLFKPLMTIEEAKQLAKCYMFQRRIQQRLGHFIRIKEHAQGMQETMKGGE